MTAMKRRLPIDLPPYVEIDAVAGRRQRGMIRHTEFAEIIGIRSQIVRRCFLRGGLPGAVQHSANIIMVPQYLVRLTVTYGLLQVERMAKTGLLVANPIDLPRRHGKRADRP